MGWPPDPDSPPPGSIPPGTAGTAAPCRLPRRAAADRETTDRDGCQAADPETAAERRLARRVPGLPSAAGRQPPDLSGTRRDRLAHPRLELELIPGAARAVPGLDRAQRVRLRALPGRRALGGQVFRRRGTATGAPYSSSRAGIAGYSAQLRPRPAAGRREVRNGASPAREVRHGRGSRRGRRGCSRREVRKRRPVIRGRRRSRRAAAGSPRRCRSRPPCRTPRAARTPRRHPRDRPGRTPAE